MSHVCSLQSNASHGSLRKNQIFFLFECFVCSIKGEDGKGVFYKVLLF
jgi:hypothetical protein